MEIIGLVLLITRLGNPNWRKKFEMSVRSGISLGDISDESLSSYNAVKKIV